MHEDAVRRSHDGYAHPVSVVRTGRRGRPKFEFDRDFLAFAITERDTTSLAKYLGVSRSVLARALQDFGLRERGEDPFIRTRTPSGSISYEQRLHFTAPRSTWSDEQLDNAIMQILIHFPNSGVSMLYGSLKVLGQLVPRARINESLFRLEPSRRLWGRTRIERSVYSVPGPNFLWHHDGQHGKQIMRYMLTSCPIIASAVTNEALSC